MKVGMAICLCLGVSCSFAAAQQTLLASAPHKPLHFAASPIATVGTAKPPISASLAESIAISGLPAHLAFYESAWSQGPAPVCTQAMLRAAAEQPIDNAFDHHLSTAALKASFTHDNLVRMARNFVPGQPLPDAPWYVPLTTKQKFEAFLRNSHSAGMAVNIVSTALISQATGAYPSIGGGMQGFGQRLGISAAGAEGAAFIGGFVYPTLFHQDPRYFASHQHSIANRLAYAASRALIGRSDDGRNVINTSVIASQFTEAAIANAYIPYRNESARGTIENALIGLGGVAQGDILNEFWPDIKDFVFRHTHNSLVRRGMEIGDPTGQQAFRSSH